MVWILASFTDQKSGIMRHRYELNTKQKRCHELNLARFTDHANCLLNTTRNRLSSNQPLISNKRRDPYHNELSYFFLKPKLVRSTCCVSLQPAPVSCAVTRLACK